MLYLHKGKRKKVISMKPGRPKRAHKVLKLFGKDDDLACIRVYLSEVQRIHNLGDRSAAGVFVLLKAREAGLFTTPAPVQDLQA